MASKLDMVLQTMKSKSKKFLVTISPDIIVRELEIVELKRKLFSSKTFKAFLLNLKSTEGQFFNHSLKQMIEQYNAIYYRNLSLNIKAFPDYGLLFDKVFEKNITRFCSSAYYNRETYNIEEYLLLAYYDFMNCLVMNKPQKVEYDYDSKAVKQLFSSEFDIFYRKVFVSERNPVLPTFPDVTTLHNSLELIDISNELPIIERKVVSLDTAIKPKYYISNIKSFNYIMFLCKDKVFGRRIVFFNEVFLQYPNFQTLEYKIVAHPFKSLPSPLSILNATIVFYKEGKIYGFVQSEEIGFN